MKLSKNTLYVTIPQHVIFIAGIVTILLGHVSWLWLIYTYFAWVIIGYFGFSVFYHRYFAHRAFEMSVFWQNIWGYIGLLAGRGSPINLASLHCGQHHPYADTDQDPQSPIKGWMWSWFLWSEHHQFKVFPKYVKHLIKNPFLCFLDRNYLRVFWISFFVMLIIDWKIAVFCMMGAGVLHYHIESAVSTFGHSPGIGSQDFKTQDNSRNIRGLFNIFVLGTGLHNNHHAFPRAYHYEQLKGDFDLARYVVPWFVKNDKV